MHQTPPVGVPFCDDAELVMHLALKPMRGHHVTRHGRIGRVLGGKLGADGKQTVVCKVHGIDYESVTLFSLIGRVHKRERRTVFNQSSDRVGKDLRFDDTCLREACGCTQFCGRWCFHTLRKDIGYAR
jgi:hypothetical protein